MSAVKLSKIEAIVPAAGKSLRFKRGSSKLLVKIGNSSILIRTLKILNRHRAINKIIILSSSRDFENTKKLVHVNKISKVKCVAPGGSARKKSVENGIKLLDKDTDFVLIHDAARPFITEKLISCVIAKAKKYGASISGVRLKSTIKQAKIKHPKKGTVSDLFVERTLNRDLLWEIQTPQVFRKELLIKAHREFKDINVTDDACLVEKLGKKVSIAEGSYFNIKITTREDLIFAKAIAKRKSFR